MTGRFPGHPAMDVSVAHALLQAVAAGEMGDVFRLHTPGRVVAFGRADRVTPGYQEAVAAARSHGFAAVERLAGGRAAVFHPRTLAFSWATSTPAPREGIRERFELITRLLLDSLTSLGLDVRVGELPGEYCPGEWSINLSARAKVVGTGQRLVRGAAHVGGVIVVDDGDAIRDVLVPVYEALGLDWDPATAGALTDQIPTLDTDHVATALIHHLGDHFDVTPVPVPISITRAAEGLLTDHLPEVA